MNLKNLSVAQLDLAFAALPVGHPLKDEIASTIERKVARGKTNTLRSDENRSHKAQVADPIEKAIQILVL